ncbi:MAG: KilA-N domain-containing protein [Metallibacterium sp.]
MISTPRPLWVCSRTAERRERRWARSERAGQWVLPGRTLRGCEDRESRVVSADEGYLIDQGIHAEGRYCLNDLHRASGGEERHRPNYWSQLDVTQELIFEVLTAGIPAVKTPLETTEGRYGGTWAVKALVYAYAMWISPRFHLHVIEAYERRPGRFVRYVRHAVRYAVRNQIIDLFGFCGMCGTAPTSPQARARAHARTRAGARRRGRVPASHTAHGAPMRFVAAPHTARRAPLAHHRARVRARSSFPALLRKKEEAV